jgi:serine phosphatase RsbU (regulator of sigma subunit)
MPRITLRQWIGWQEEARALLQTLAGALGTPIAVEDNDGRLLHGKPIDGAAVRCPVMAGDLRLGWVSANEHAPTVAVMLGQLVSMESERRALGAEVLHLYREVNLIYGFSEKLAALLDLDRVAELTLRQARHLITATDGVLLLLDESTGELSVLAGFGTVLPRLSGLRSGRGVIGSVVATGIGEIVDDLDEDPRPRADMPGIRSLVCAPLTVGERVIGAIVLGCTEQVDHAAGDLKLLTTLALQTATAIENARLFERTVEAARERERLLALHQAAELARAKLESEFELAARIQSGFFPSEMPPLPGYDLAARNRPARRCGGDYYDALNVPGANGDGRMLMCVADVSGKGLPASLVMSNMQATLRALLGRLPSLPDLASRASDLLYASTAPEKYVTAALFELEPDSGVARYVSAGHAQNLVLKASGEVIRLSSTGAPLGLLGPGLAYQQTDLVLESGDCVVLYSDGVPDAQNESDEEFGEDRLLDVLRASREAPAEVIVARVFEAIDAFAAGAPQFDDITLLVLRRL